MYNDFYGFREAPFNITPDPRFLFFSDKHREAFNHVLFGIRERKGFIQITGEVGAGKTTVCRAILAELGPTYKTALILNPMVTSTQMMRTILTELGLEPRKLDRTAYLEILNRFLLEQADGRPRRRAPDRRGPGPRARAARAGAPALEPRDRPAQAPPDRPDRPARAARQAQRARAAPAPAADHGALPPGARSTGSRPSATSRTASASPAPTAGRRSRRGRFARSTGTRGACRG